MGEPKQQLSVGCETFLSRTMRIASSVFQEVFTVDRPRQGAVGELHEIFEDAHEGDGAMFGVSAALRHAPPGKIWILAVDYPRMPAEMLQFLGAEFVRHPTCNLLVPEWSGRLQTLCAGYSSTIFPEIGKRIEGGHLRMRDLANSRGAKIVSEALLREKFAGEPFLNVNERAEYESLGGLDEA